MRLTEHRISGAAFAGLARGAGGARAVAELCAAQTSKHRLLLRLLVDGARDAVVDRAYDVLADLEPGAPEEVGRCLRHPAVAAWALRACRGRADPRRLAALALAAAVRTRTACRLEAPVRGGRLMLPSLGLVTLPVGVPELATVSVEPAGDGAELRVGGHTRRVCFDRDGPGWQALRRVPFAADVLMTVDDLDPYRWPGDDVDGRLSEERRRLWASCLREAGNILRARHWTVSGELATAVSVLTPVVTRSEEQHSASARDTFGTIALSDPINGMGMAVTLAHELQHAKLYALADVVDLTGPDDGRRFYAPWRPDPRPLSGLLHGAYAHAGVAGFWRRHLEDGLRGQVEFARWREAAYEVTGTLLDSGALTGAGTRFVATLRETLARWRAEPVPDEAAALARLASDRHRTAWSRT
ncbi:MAG TPA: HEXXH motif domain-containing protein [Nonomuraea sp.]|nr:HEXXH motif domain-containing protein [Nonomuraea sp.]